MECETVGEGRPRDFNRSEILRLKFVKLKFQELFNTTYIYYLLTVFQKWFGLAFLESMMSMIAWWFVLVLWDPMRIKPLDSK